MFGKSESSSENYSGGVQNEISITNLINIACNDSLFHHLDYDTQGKLMDIIKAYTEVCIDEIMKSNNTSYYDVGTPIVKRMPDYYKNTSTSDSYENTGMPK